MPNLPERYDPTVGLGPVDRILLRGAASHKSPEELSRLTGTTVKPAAAAQRVIDILKSQDWLSQVQQKQLLIHDLMAIKDKLMHEVIDLNMTKDNAGTLVRVLKEIGDRLDKDKLDLNAALTQIRKAHAEMMLAAIRVAFERSALELEKRYPQVSKTELNEVFRMALPEAAREIEAHVVEPD
jgi:hypothetical protein